MPAISRKHEHLGVSVPDSPAAPAFTAEFWRFLAGFGGSLLADGIWFVCLGWAASRLGSPVATSLVLAAASVPRAALLIPGGAVADRLGAFPVVRYTQILRLVCLAVAVGAAVAGWLTVWTLLPLAILFGLLDALHMPAASSLPPLLLSRSQLPAGQGAVQTMDRVSLVVASGVGGVLIGAFGLSAALLAAFAALGAALPLLLSLGGHLPPTAARPPELERAGFVEDCLAGVRHAARHPVIGPALLVVTTGNLVLMPPLNVGLPLLTAERGWAPSVYGALLAVFSFGAAVGAVGVTRWRARRAAAAGLVWVAVGCLFLAGLAVASRPLLAEGAAFGLGVTTGTSSALLIGYIQSFTAAEHMGKVMALVAFSALGLTPVGYLLFGMAADTIGLVATLLLCAGLELVVVLGALTLRSLRGATPT